MSDRQERSMRGECAHDLKTARKHLPTSMPATARAPQIQQGPRGDTQARSPSGEEGTKRKGLIVLQYEGQHGGPLGYSSSPSLQAGTDQLVTTPQPAQGQLSVTS